MTYTALHGIEIGGSDRYILNYANHYMLLCMTACLKQKMIWTRT